MGIQTTPERISKTLRARPPLTVTVSDGIPTSPPSGSKVPYVLDSITPKTRRVSRLPVSDVSSDVHAQTCSTLSKGLRKESLSCFSTLHMSLLLTRPSCCPFQRSYALEMACRCVEDAYQAREGPTLQHASHFRAFGYKILKKALCLKGLLLFYTSETHARMLLALLKSQYACQHSTAAKCRRTELRICFPVQMILAHPRTWQRPARKRA